MDVKLFQNKKLKNFRKQTGSQWKMLVIQINHFSLLSYMSCTLGNQVEEVRSIFMEVLLIINRRVRLLPCCNLEHTNAIRPWSTATATTNRGVRKHYVLLDQNAYRHLWRKHPTHQPLLRNYNRKGHVAWYQRRLKAHEPTVMKRPYLDLIQTCKPKKKKWRQVEMWNQIGCLRILRNHIVIFQVW